MQPIIENASLKAYNTFGIDAKARWLSSFANQEELSGSLNGQSLLILGGGSNILFTLDFDGLVLRNEIKGIELVREDEQYIYIRAGAGESWHSFVQHALQRNWAGVENLSLIPGSVGAAPMQNIGAYGVEIKDVFHELEAFDLQERVVVKFGLKDCGFGYRESVFKRQYKNRFVILSVTYRLNKQPKFATSYGAIEQELEKMHVQHLSIQAISEAVIRIRSSKLPDPKEVGNAGSFFKNPSVPAAQFQKLKAAHPGIVGYPNADGSVKLAAGWMIEQCGWKGYRKGDAGCHAMQALVLVNYGQATGSEIYELSTAITESVQKTFGVELEREVNIF
jgi:UDP-N-acetylmuramate dehydrogenase